MVGAIYFCHFQPISQQIGIIWGKVEGYQYLLPHLHIYLTYNALLIKRAAAILSQTNHSFSLYIFFPKHSLVSITAKDANSSVIIQSETFKHPSQRLVESVNLVSITRLANLQVLSLVSSMFSNGLHA